MPGSRRAIDTIVVVSSGIVVPSANIADVMKKAIVAIEDKRFYEHNGVDATGIARALVTNLGDSGRRDFLTTGQAGPQSELVSQFWGAPVTFEQA